MSADAGSGRQRWLRGTSGVLAVFWGLLFFGLIDLLAFLQGPDFHDTILLSTGWGLLFLFLLAGPLAALCLSSGNRTAAASLQVASVALALLLAAVLSTAPRYLLAAAAVAGTALLVSFLGATSSRNELRTWRWSLPPALVLATAVVPVGHYAWVSARNSGTGVTTDDTNGLDHWPAQAAFAITLLLLAAVAVGHPRGWQLPTWSVVLCSSWFGVVALAEPHLVGSLSRPWALAVLLWTVIFTIVVRTSRPLRAGGS